MTATLPGELRDVFDRYVTTEYVTIDRRGHPVAAPVTPRHHVEEGCIDVSTALAGEARRNPHVALLFSDATGSGLERAPMVLVQGTAAVEEPETVHVRPERIFVWPEGDVAAEPTLYGAHVEEVRSGHDELPDEPRPGPEGGATAWSERVQRLGSDDYRTAVLALCSPDGFPFAVRVPVRADGDMRLVRIEAAPLAVPWQPGLACLATRDLQLRGDLVEHGGWALAPHEVVGE